ncbi:hypothetical protein WOLCODRAFT_51538, partial [Wolfiporia cocos MD-104 SS10]
RLKQIGWKEEHIGHAVENLCKSRQRAIDDFMRRHERAICSELAVGTWVLVHETWLDLQQGNKGALRWSGPYIIHEKYQSGSYCLRELDGTVLKEPVAANRLKLFYYREDRQTIETSLA